MLEGKPTLRDLMTEVREVNTANGWFEDTRSFGEDAALLHSEVSEALEAYRDHGVSDLTLAAHAGRIVKPEGFGSELADVLIRWLDTVERQSMTLDAASSLNLPLDKIQPVPVEGSVGDQLDSLHTAIANRQHSRVLRLLVGICMRNGVDLEWEYNRKIAYNRTRGFRHGNKAL